MHRPVSLTDCTLHAFVSEKMAAFACGSDKEGSQEVPKGLSNISLEMFCRTDASLFPIVTDLICKWETYQHTVTFYLFY